MRLRLGGYVCMYICVLIVVINQTFAIRLKIGFPAFNSLFRVLYMKFCFCLGLGQPWNAGMRWKISIDLLTGIN